MALWGLEGGTRALLPLPEAFGTVCSHSTSDLMPAGANENLYIYFIMLWMHAIAHFISHCYHFDKELVELTVKHGLWRTGGSLICCGLRAFLMFLSSRQKWACI